MKKLIKAIIGITFLALLAGCDNLSLYLGTPTADPETGIITGTIYDATTNTALSGVAVRDSGDSTRSAVTDTDGTFTLTTIKGNRTITFSKTGYDFAPTILESETSPTDVFIAASPTLDDGEIRFVLTWGSSPDDLDAYLSCPNGDVVYYFDDSTTGANLDTDDQSAYGPETITITAAQSGIYSYYIYNASFVGNELIASDAKVQVFDSTGLLYTQYVPTSGTGDYWNVFTYSDDGINDPELTPIETITASPTIALQE